MKWMKEWSDEELNTFYWLCMQVILYVYMKRKTYQSYIHIVQFLFKQAMMVRHNLQRNVKYDENNECACS